MREVFKKSNNVTLAIDYGTSNSLVAATDGITTTPPLPIEDFGLAEDGQIHQKQSTGFDRSIFRSILYFPNQNQCFYGAKAITEYCENQSQGRLIRSIKKYLPISTYQGSWIEDRIVRIEDLIGFFLLEMRKRACKILDKDITSVLLGRPAKFSNDPVKDEFAQERLKRAAQIAGFKDISFLPEPLAAAFDLKKTLTSQKIALVVDLGGGTSDFTVIKIGPQPFSPSDVLSIGGVSIAGDVIDGDIMKEKISPFFGSKVQYRIPMGRNIMQMPASLLTHICSPADISQLRKNEYFEFFKNVKGWTLKATDKERMNNLVVLVEEQLGFSLFEEIDRIKRELSARATSTFKFNEPEIKIETEVSKEEFQNLSAASVEKILTTMNSTLADAQVASQDIDIVYCTGGTSKLAAIQSALVDQFGPEKVVGGQLFQSVLDGLAAYAAEQLRK